MAKRNYERGVQMTIAWESMPGDLVKSEFYHLTCVLSKTPPPCV